MKRSIEVHLGEKAQRVGTLHYNQDGNRERSAFEYHGDWLAGSEPFPIEPALRLIRGPQFFKASKDGSKFNGAIADTEPDGWGRRVILRDHAKRREQIRAQGGKDLPPPNALDFLLAVDDRSRMGALRLRDDNQWQRAAPESGQRTTPPILELPMLFAATRAVENQTETEADLAYLRGRGTSLGGLRPKCTLLDNEGRLAIGKFPSVQDTRAVTKGEVLALRLATAAGISAASSKLIDSDGVSVAVIQRFDRTESGERIPYVSAATMLGRDADGDVHTYTEIVDALRIHGAAAKDDIEELWRRIAFSILITNVDDHLHNHGFLHSSGELWRLAPAFDINPFPDRQRDLKTWISEETGPDSRIESLWSVLKYFNISRVRAKTILGEVEAAVSRWRDVGRKEADMSNKELEEFIAAFEHSEREAARAYI